MRLPKTESQISDLQMILGASNFTFLFQMLRESLTTESLEVNKRVDKVNLYRMNDTADIQSKVSPVGVHRDLEGELRFFSLPR